MALTAPILTAPITTNEIETNGKKKEALETSPITSPVSTTSEQLGPNAHISSHPVLLHKISVLRSSSTLPSTFRHVLREITFHLGYEATATLTTRPKSLTVPIGDSHVNHVGATLKERVCLIPILRSGLGMVDSMLELLPKADVHHIGMYKQNMMPVQYYNRLPRKCVSDVAYILDPMMATCQTMKCVIGILKKWGVPKINVITVIASKQGLLELMEIHPDVHFTVGAVDSEVTENGVIIPGLGDAGDRLFGTPMIEDEEEDLMHPSKRKRSI